MQDQFNLDFIGPDRPETFINVEKIVTVYYHEFTKSYSFAGEKHDFWELVYVDSGEVTVSADGTYYNLSKGDIIFHKPNEFHTISGNGFVPSNVLVTSFVARSPQMAFFENRIMNLKESETKFLSHYIIESRSVFKNSMGRLYEPSNRQARPYIGSEQMMYLLLEQFLITLVRLESDEKRVVKQHDLLKREYDDETVRHVIAFLETHLAETIHLDDICQKFFLSKTFLKNHFKAKTDFTVMEYLRILRINKAKELIRRKELTFTEVAERTGYNTVHHFSNSFKQLTGMTPSEYETSIQ